MIGTFARVLTGFILACLTAALIQVLYLPTTYQLATSADNLFPGSLVLERVLLVATHALIFASAFALIVAGIGEWMGLSSLPYYLISGVVIALLGFTAQYSSEVASQPTIFNNYAMNAYLTSGFFAGLVYWLVSGRYARNEAREESLGDSQTSGVPAPKSWKSRPKIVVEDNPGRPKANREQRGEGDGKDEKKPTLSKLLKEAQEADTEIKPAFKAGSSSSSSPSAATPSTTSVPSTKGPAPATDPLKKA
jgi:hypothetical protein